MRVVFDAGVILGILDGELGRLAEEVASGRLAPYITAINMAEVHYVLCRRLGPQTARSVVEGLLNSRVVKLVEAPDLHRLAADCKCRLPIALGDCYAIALARLMGTKAYFRREKEIVEALERDETLRRYIELVP